MGHRQHELVRQDSLERPRSLVEISHGKDADVPERRGADAFTDLRSFYRMATRSRSRRAARHCPRSRPLGFGEVGRGDASEERDSTLSAPAPTRQALDADGDTPRARSSRRSAHIRASDRSTASRRPSMTMTSPPCSSGIVRCVRRSSRSTTGWRATPSRSGPRAVGRIRRIVRSPSTRCAALATGLHELGAVAHAYAPIYAVGNEFAAEHPEMLMYEDNGSADPLPRPDRAGQSRQREWQRTSSESYGAAADAIGFDGFHVDTYGYPRGRNDADGSPSTCAPPTSRSCARSSAAAR